MHASDPDGQSQPRIRSLHSQERARPSLASLPVPLTSLVGRTLEVAAILNLFDMPDCRLVTLTGPGGVGKTRLALQVALTAHNQGFEIAFLPLDAVDNADLVGSSIAKVFDVRYTGDRPSLDRLVSAIGSGRVLLVIDNFEQVVSAAPLLVNLLQGCPHLKILVTSRKRLRVSGEFVFDVPALQVPDPAHQTSADDLVAHDAVRLFVARARAVRASFDLTPENSRDVGLICHHLEGLPLAIELAAAQMRTSNPGAILGRLEHRLTVLTGGPVDQPARLQTMRAAIRWSYDALPLGQQAFVRALAVFAGSFTIEATSIGLSPDEARASPALGSQFDLLNELVDASLVQALPAVAGEPRFTMLETLREFCLEELAAHGELPGRRAAHAWYFVTFAEQAGDMLTSPDQGGWLDLLEAAHGDLRAALAWTEENGRSDMMLRIASAIWWFWAIRGHWAEGRRWLSGGIEREQEASRLRAQACFGLGSIMSLQGDLEESITFASEALSTFSVLGDQSRTAQAHLLLGRTSRRQGNTVVARHHFDEAHAMFRELRDERWIASALHNLGLIAYDDGRYADATTYLSESLEIWKTLGYEWGLASCIPGHLGDIARVQDDEHQALSFYLEALVRNRHQGDRSEIAGLLVGIASVTARRDASTAAYLLGSASALREMLQAHLISREADDVRVATEVICSTLGNGAFAQAFEEGSTADLSAVLVEAEQLVARFMTVLGPEPVVAESDLSARELGVLRLVAEGLTDKEIALELGISRRTVSKHIELILRKMEVPSRTAAVTKATRRKILT